MIQKSIFNSTEDKILANKQMARILARQQGAKRLEEACKFYYKMVDDRIDDFQEVKRYLEHILEELLQEEKIGNGVIVLSRIKSPISVIENWKLGKNLHDIFGITLLTQTQDEVEEISKKMREENKLNVTSKKEMHQKKGYEALHLLFNIEHGEKQKTNIECHMQTHEAYKNVYPHVFYKVRRCLDRDLTPEDERAIEEKIQTMFENGELSGKCSVEGKKTRLPQMWVSTFNNDKKMEEMELDELQTLLIMYPSLDLSKKEDGR